MFFEWGEGSLSKMRHSFLGPFSKIRFLRSGRRDRQKITILNDIVYGCPLKQMQFRAIYATAITFSRYFETL